MDNNQFLPKGTLLGSGSYRIEDVLGHGGFGITYLATNINLDKKVAIKEFFPGTFCSRDDSSTRIVTMGTAGTEIISRYKEKFLKEARNIAKLRHPNIIGIHAAFEENDTAYYAMEFIEGGSLSQLVKREGPLPVEKAMELIRQVGEALDYLHDRKMNHLDVKPANIMVREDGTAVLIDFGLSKQYDETGNQTSTTPVGISHGFAPLEQYNPEGVKEFSREADLYSLGATFYYLITGTIPPNASDLLDGELQFPAVVPQQLRPVIAKSMSPARGKRYKSARDFYNDLKNPHSADATQMVGVHDDKTQLVTGGGGANSGGGSGVRNAGQYPNANDETHVVINTDYTPLGSPEKVKNDRKMKFIYLAGGAVALGIIVWLLIAFTGSTNNSIMNKPVEELSYDKLDSDLFRKLLVIKINKFKDDYQKEYSSYNSTEEFFRGDYLDYIFEDSWGRYELAPNKLPVPQKIDLTEEGLWVDYGRVLNKDEYSPLISFTIPYDELIPVLSENGLATIPRDKIQKHIERVSTVSERRVDKLLDIYDWQIKALLSDSTYYIRGVSKPYYDMTNLQTMSYEIEPDEGGGDEEAQRVPGFQIVSQDDAKAKVEIKYRSAYDSSIDSASVVLVKEKVKYPSGLEVDMWLIDDTETFALNYMDSREEMANRVNDVYERLNNPEQYQEMYDWAREMSVGDNMDKWHETVEKFKTQMLQLFPDGVAK